MFRPIYGLCLDLSRGEREVAGPQCSELRRRHNVHSAWYDGDRRHEVRSRSADRHPAALRARRRSGTLNNTCKTAVLNLGRKR